MNQTLSVRILALFIPTLIFPIAALADLNQTIVLQTNNHLSLDTGDAPSSGGDLLWNGVTLTPQGTAKAYNVGDLGATNFDGLPQSYWVTLSQAAKSSPIAANLLVPGDAFVATTSSGKVAKVLVAANSGGAITLRFTTFGVTASGPAVSQILNNSSLIPPGLPNSGIAPSSIFIVQGSGLSDAGTPVLQDTQRGLPLTLNGASISVVVGGVTTHPALYYTSPTQLAAVLPAATPLGTGTLTVNYGGANSAPSPIQVVASAIGFNHFNQIPIPAPFFNENVDIGVAQDLTGAVLTSTHSGSPGQTITLWITGLGADPADSDTTYTSSPHPVNTPLQLYFGGVLVTNIGYQGSAGYPGVNIINLTIPASVPTGCYVPLAAVTGNVISNVVVFPIHPGGGSCVETSIGGTITGDQILLNTKDTLKAGGVTLVQTNSTNAKGVLTVTNSAAASFQKYTGLLAAATGRGALVSADGCAVGPLVAGGPLTLAGLDAESIRLTGPAGLALPLPSQFGLAGAYGATLPAGAIPASGGSFTFMGSGGTDVGVFTSTVTLSNPILNWTNQSAAVTVDRTQGLLVTWTGGNPGTTLAISGTSTSTASGVIAGFGCRVAAEKGQFTVPAYILQGLPAGSGGVNVQNDVISAFSATGLDTTTAVGTISFSQAATFK